MSALFGRALLFVVVLSSSTVFAEEAPRHEVTLAWWNDLFSELPPADDSGFTNDFELEAMFATSVGSVGGRAFYRIITEQFGEGDEIPTQRWDQLDLLAQFERETDVGVATIRWHGRAGLALAGPLGGLAIQDGWHGLTGTGATIEQGLQSRYNGTREVGAVVGGRVDIARTFAARKNSVTARASVDLQGSVGATGIRYAKSLVGVGTRLALGNAVVITSGELGLARFATADDNLKLRGAYGTTKAEFFATLTLGLAIRTTAFGYTYRANESGSGEPVGLLWLKLSL